MMRLTEPSALDKVITVSRDRKRPARSMTATIARCGLRSTANVTSRSLTSIIVDGRPRGRRTIAPSRIQPSPINCSTMMEIVLGCNPEKRASSMRDTGCRKRMSSSTMSRLISRAFSLEANCAEDRSIRRMPRARDRPAPAEFPSGSFITGLFYLHKVYHAPLLGRYMVLFQPWPQIARFSFLN